MGKITIFFLIISATKTLNKNANSFYDCFKINAQSETTDICNSYWLINPLKTTPKCADFFEKNSQYNFHVCTDELFVSFKAFYADKNFIEEIDISFKNGAFHGVLPQKTGFLGYSINWNGKDENPIIFVKPTSNFRLLGIKVHFSDSGKLRKNIEIRSEGNTNQFPVIRPIKSKDLLKTYFGPEAHKIKIFNNDSWWGKVYALSEKEKYIVQENPNGCNVVVKTSKLSESFKYCKRNLFLCVDMTSDRFKRTSAHVSHTDGKINSRLDVVESVLGFSMANFALNSEALVTLYGPDIINTFSKSKTVHDFDLLDRVKKSMALTKNFGIANVTKCIESHLENSYTSNDDILIFSNVVNCSELRRIMNEKGIKRVVLINEMKDLSCFPSLMNEPSSEGIEIMSYEEVYKGIDRDNNFLTAYCKTGLLSKTTFFYLWIGFVTSSFLGLFLTLVGLFCAKNKMSESDIPMNLLNDSSRAYKEIDVECPTIHIVNL